MAELLIVVAIITILAGVGFIAVQSHQRSLAQVERNSIAKEIYFAAQNHLAMAESQGYLGVTDYGTPSTAAEDVGKNIYYAVNNGSAPTQGTMLDLMLPFGSIDETVRSGGSYLIRYQVDPAIVLDVFYCSVSGTPTRFNHTIGDGEYATFMGYAPDRLPGSGYVAGYYGGTEAGLIGDYDVVKPPEVIVENGDRLIVKVKDTTPSGAQAHDADGNQVTVDTYLELIITGETRDGKTAKAVILVKKPTGASYTPNKRVSGPDTDGYYTVVLDDITTAKPTSIVDGMHFADLNGYSDNSSGSDIWFMPDPATGATPQFVPGEDITVEAVAFSNDAFTNIAYSSAKTTNSLFADEVSEDGADDHTSVNVGSFRHLENLDSEVSGLDSTLVPTNANQTSDLFWTTTADGDVGFVDAVKAAKGADSVQVYKYATRDGSADGGSGAGCYLPVNIDYELTYDGAYTEGEGDAAVKKCHAVTGVKVGAKDSAYSGDGGLFGKPAEALNVSNLALVDFEVHATGNAGALAGSLAQGGTVSNVVAYNTDAFENAAGGAASIASTGSGTSAGSAGGLIGSMTNASLDRCAAAVIVESAGKNAGGLVGDAFGTGTVTDSYSGGHTVNAAAPEGYAYDGDKLNVTSASGSAGGLIGNSGQVEISNCYSTCSVKGAVAGGLVGDAGSIVEDSYCTGMVRGASATATVGAFAGKLTVDPENCHYLEIMNPIDDAVTYMPPVSGKTMEDYGEGALSPFDATATAYNEFVGDGDLAAALPYSVALKDFGEYPLRPLSGVNATASATAPADFVATHYGDWPMPETLVVNTK